MELSVPGSKEAGQRETPDAKNGPGSSQPTPADRRPRWESRAATGTCEPRGARGEHHGAVSHPGPHPGAAGGQPTARTAA
ncbi:hypothetical protein GCM10010249_22270 [Streptomyces roseolilacinus]|uniref:Uncharacterized protein n=1 Tax=Streptomyces roseolilacinus TaxID=66904 RepID=A0A918EJ85_9ACTN|nr:hypothetical protein GCM10010249_22270 [Streptomyces roseolilacinus]